MTVEQWKPSYNSDYYRARISDLAREIADHLKKHEGVPLSACHRCMAFTVRMRDLKDLLEYVIEFERNEGDPNKNNEQ